ncbi:hypothetical protein IM697_03660 [Streptomyces ferrugineus]|uniref:ATP-binding protein n=1 Tax=Streptomyces ferrugineus TaxID=1413221 RepID=A0A7M2SQL6_9ACTN|nr:hypothetical protein [Streptomyces ferrugineus]QOV37541.1 hypothetical protein IM697_03660 [Streptomyces ferrugineus]
MRTTRARLTVAAAVLAGVLAAGTAPAAALPLPLPAAGAGPLVTEGLTVEGPLINNLSLPTLK